MFRYLDIVNMKNATLNRIVLTVRLLLIFIYLALYDEHMIIEI